MSNPTIILGAGLTGMTAAHRLHRQGRAVRVLEADPFLGGASRTVQFGDFRFDLGGHRFYTRNKEILDLVNELLPGEIVNVDRLSRICLRGKFVDYPLSFFNALSALGPITSVGVAASYACEKLAGVVRKRPDDTFENWVVSRFGRRLYEIYFKPYSEKVWGIPCKELGADFAAQRIKGLSFREAVKNMIFRNGNAPATLASRFLYPATGFGRIPEAMAAAIPQDAVQLSSPVIRLEHDGKRITAVVSRVNGREERHTPDHVVSTMPLTDLLRVLSPAVPAEVLQAASTLRYRDMVILFLTLNKKQVTPDHWIYFSTDDTFFGRIHEPKNWSAKMAPADQTGLVVEVFCFDSEPVWNESEESLRPRIAKRLEELKLIRQDEVAGSTLVRLRKAYPLYVPGYQERLNTILNYLSRFENLHVAGRNGLYFYTSGDYYIEMGLRAADNVMGAKHDLTLIGSAKEYAEK